MPHTFHPRHNQILDVIGKSKIQNSIVKEVNKAKLFSVMVDEITKNICHYVFGLLIAVMKLERSF